MFENLKNTLNFWVKEEIIVKMRKYLEISGHENTISKL